MLGISIWEQEQIVEVSPALIWVSLALSVAFYLVMYLLRSFGLYAIALREKRRNAFLAFIPVAWVYLAGKLAGGISFFGGRFKRPEVVLLVVFAVSQLLTITYWLLGYVPLIGYGLNAGQIVLAPSGNLYNSSGYMSYPFDYTIFVGTNFAFDYSNAYSVAVSVLSIIADIADILSFFMMIAFYATFFRKYWIEHSFLGLILSIFGFFPIMVFIVRNKEAVDYQEYIKRRMAMYGGSTVRAESKEEEPFAEYSDKKDDTSQEPFSEFDDKKD